MCRCYLYRARKLNIEKVFLGVKDKEACVEQLLRESGLGWENLAYVGDDVNDHCVLTKAGLSACPADAPGVTREKVKYVCQRAGGHGAVREVCEIILAVCDDGGTGC